MDFKAFFEKVVATLKHERVRYALAGGLVASLYRREERLTKDLDFLLMAESHSQQAASHIIHSLGLHSHVVRKADLEGGPLFAIKKKNTPPYIVIGRDKGDPSKIGLDFILPEMPWFSSALNRAEQNNINFGFGKLPCLTIEDVIISKLFSYKNDKSRFNDLDDLKSIFLAKRPLDLAYLAGQMQNLGLAIPELIQERAPGVLKLVSRGRVSR